MKKELIKTARAGSYLAPQCEVFALEGGQVMDPGSTTLPTVAVTQEEDW